MSKAIVHTADCQNPNCKSIMIWNAKKEIYVCQKCKAEYWHIEIRNGK